MGEFMVLVKGTGYTSHVHHSAESAVTEAKRLFGVTGMETQILEIVGTVKMEEVPVVKKEMVVRLNNRLINDDLPF